MTHPLSLHILHITLSPSSVTSHPPYHPLHITPPPHPLSLHILHITLSPSSLTSHPPYHPLRITIPPILCHFTSSLCHSLAPHIYCPLILLSTCFNYIHSLHLYTLYLLNLFSTHSTYNTVHSLHLNTIHSVIYAVILFMQVVLRAQ